MVASPASIIDRLKGGLIVSCQALEEDGFYGPSAMAAMARAAALGGAAGIRANGPDDIAAIRAVTDLPIIGICKLGLSAHEVRITPSLEAARAVVEAGADIVALDATDRPHPDGLAATDLIRLVRQELKALVMADVSTLSEGIQAARAGADLVATTLSGYTPYSPHHEGPDFDLVARLAQAIERPVVSEGRIATPHQARRMLELGAHAVVVGSMITRPRWIVERFVSAMRAADPAQVVLALDIGGTKLLGGVVDGTGRVLLEDVIPSLSEQGGQVVLERAVALLDRLCQAYQGPPPAAVGVSTGGQVNSEGRVVYASDLMPGWANLPLKEELARRLGLPVVVVGDGHAAALGEARFGAGRGRASVLAVTVGTGLGGGIVVDGEIYRGAWDASGFIGHIKIVRNGRPCTCGGKGCLEAYVSGPALLAEYNARAAQALASASEVAARAAEGDALAREAVEATGAWLGFGLAGVVAVLNPEVIVVGGGVAQTGDLFLDSIRRSLRTHSFPAVRETPVLPAALGPYAGLVGAAVAAQRTTEA